MENKNIFSNFSAIWTCWSEYRIVERQGNRYIMPCGHTTAFIYSGSENLQGVLTDALNLGKTLYQAPERKEEACLIFAQKHGLLGLQESAGGKVLMMKEGRVASARKRNGSQKYGEDLECFAAEFQKLYLHFLYTRDELPEHLPKCMQNSLMALIAQPIPCGLSYYLTTAHPPEMVWQADKLIDILHLTYGIAVTDATMPLKVCKNCGAVYYNTHQKSEFCSVKCRNVFNVRAFRGKRGIDRIAE